MEKIKLILGFSILLLVSGQINATVIWDNLASNYSAVNSWTSPSGLDSHIGADDFYIKNSKLVTGADVFVLSPNQLSSWDGDISWWLFEESFYQEANSTQLYSKPGKIIQSGEGINITSEYKGETLPGSLGTHLPPYSAYKVSFTFDDPVLLSGESRYWFGTNFSSNSSGEILWDGGFYYYWMTYDLPVEDIGIRDDWIFSASDGIWALHGESPKPVTEPVPEPSIIALLLTGIFSLGISRRRMKK